MKAKEFIRIISKFPKDMFVYMQTSWELSGEYHSGYLPLQSIIVGTPVKRLKNGRLKKNNCSKTKTFTFSTITNELKSCSCIAGEEALTVNEILKLLSPTQFSDWLITRISIIVGMKNNFFGYIDPEYKAKISGIKKQKKYEIYDEDFKGKKKVLLLTEI